MDTKEDKFLKQICNFEKEVNKFIEKESKLYEFCKENPTPEQKAYFQQSELFKKNQATDIGDLLIKDDELIRNIMMQHGYDPERKSMGLGLKYLAFLQKKEKKIEKNKDNLKLINNIREKIIFAQKTFYTNQLYSFDFRTEEDFDNLSPTMLF